MKVGIAFILKEAFIKMEIFYNFYKVFFTGLLIFYLYKMMFKGISKMKEKFIKY